MKMTTDIAIDIRGCSRVTFDNVCAKLESQGIRIPRHVRYPVDNEYSYLRLDHRDGKTRLNMYVHHGGKDVCGTLHFLTTGDLPTSGACETQEGVLWGLINSSGQYNGHSQIEITSLPIKQCLEITRELDENYHDLVSLRIMWDGSYLKTYSASIYAEDYWGEGGNAEGHKDRLLMSIGEVIYED